MDYYSAATARTALPCSKEQYDNIRRLIDEEWESDDPCSLNCVYTSDGKVWFYTDESCYPENIDSELARAIAEVVRQNGENYLEFGVACYGSRNVIDGNSGYHFRISSGAEVEFQHHMWISAPEETEVGRLILDLIQASRCALADMEGLALDEIDDHPASETIQELRDAIARAERMGFEAHRTSDEVVNLDLGIEVVAGDIGNQEETNGEAEENDEAGQDQ